MRAELPGYAAFLLAAVVASSAQAAPASYSIDPAHSRIVIHVRKAGAFSGALHDHAFVPQRWSGEVSFDPEAPRAARGEVVVQADSLRDEEEGLSNDDRAKVEAQARGPDVLDAARYPQIVLHVQGLELAGRPVEGKDVQVTLDGTLDLHGKTEAVRIPLTARWTPSGLEAHGSVRFRQTTFGIKPLNKMLGAIAVHDEVVMELSVRGAARGR